MHTDLNQATSDFCPVLTELLQTRKAVGRTGRIYKGLAALSTHNNLYVVYELVRETRAPLAKVLQFLRTSVPRTGLNELDLSCYREKDKFTYRVARYLGKVQLTAFRRVGNVERAWDAPFHSF